MGTEVIAAFRDENYFLSNFSPSEIRHRAFPSRVFPTAEHVFQSCKPVLTSQSAWIADAPTAKEAKNRGHQVECHEGWEAMKRAVMLQVLLWKFTQNPELGAKLVATGDAVLVEGNTWGDDYWGAVSKKVHQEVPTWWTTAEDGFGTLYGHNWLGRTLMMVREVLS